MIIIRIIIILLIIIMLLRDILLLLFIRVRCVMFILRNSMLRLLDIFLLY